MSELAWLASVIVLIPLLSSVVPVVASLRYERVGWWVAAASLGVTFVLTVVLVAEILAVGTISYEMGGIPAPFGVELYADAFSGTVLLLDILMALGVLAYTRTAGPRGNAFYSGYLLLTGGMMGIILTGDLFNLYIFFEMMGIAAYALVASAESRWSTYAAFKYLILGTVGAMLYLLGVAFTFAATGTLNMADLSIRLAEVGYTDPAVVAGFTLMTIGLALKIALFPLHTWLADAHAAAPSAISALISGLMPAVAVYAFVRVIYSVFTTDFLAANPIIAEGLIYGTILSLLIGNLFAIVQRQIKLMLAYSTISQFGLIVVGLMIANETALFGSILQMFGHGIIKGGLFILAGMFALRFDAYTLEEYAGLAKRAPILGATFVALSITMIGLPPSVGFMGKWYIALGAIEEGLWLIAALIVVSTVMTLAYTVPFINQLYFRPFDDDRPDRPNVTTGMVIAVVLAAVVGLTLGLASAWIETVLREVITTLVQ